MLEVVKRKRMREDKETKLIETERMQRVGKFILESGWFGQIKEALVLY